MNCRVAISHGKKTVTATVVSIGKCLMIIGVAILAITVPATPQNSELQQKLAAVKQAAAENKQKLHEYQWIETTQLTLKGDPKPSSQKSCHYGPDGQVQKTPIGPPPEQPSGGRMKQRVIEKKKEEMKDYMEDVKGVLSMYVPPDPQRMQQAIEAGKVSLNPAGGAVNLVFTDYAQPGDRMTLTFDPAAKKITSLSVNTYMGETKDAVTLQVQMASLPDGTNYAQQTVLNATAKQLVVTTTNSNYQRLAEAQSGQSGYSGQGVPLTADELQQLLAPIALYPDSLVAQILGAATFPDQIAAAAGWLQQNSSLKGPALMQAVDAQSWEPSVKALTQFPSVLDNLAKNLSWTSAMGEAYHTQATDVMSAVQVLRAKAKAAGNLKSGSQITVVQESPQVIVIQPANPQVVYVPVYNPTVVYGYPYVTPAYVAPPVAATAVVAFGAGIAVGAMMSSNCCVWGYSSWNCGWHGTTAVVYHGGAYYGNSAWHGGYYGSSGSAYGAYGGSAHYSNGYNPSTGTYARGGTVSNGYGSASAGQAYNPRTGASASTVQGSNAYGSYGASTASKNGTTVDSQHQTNSNGTTGQMHSSTGASAYGATGKNGNSAAVGETANGNKYAAANGKTYSNTGSGWDQKSGSPSSYNKSSSSGWGGQEKSGGSSAMDSGGGGWNSRSASARGSSSMGRSGGWGGGGGRGRR